MEKLVLKAIEQTKVLVNSKPIDKSLSAEQQILKHDDVFIGMIYHIVAHLTDDQVKKIWKKYVDVIIDCCDDKENPFDKKGKQGIEIYLEEAVFEHFDVWGFDKCGGKKSEKR